MPLLFKSGDDGESGWAAPKEHHHFKKPVRPPMWFPLGFMWFIIANDLKKVFIASTNSILGCKTGFSACLALLSLFIIA